MKLSDNAKQVIEAALLDAIAQIRNETAEQLSLYGSIELPEPMVDDLVAEFVETMTNNVLPEVVADLAKTLAAQ